MNLAAVVILAAAAASPSPSPTPAGTCVTSGHTAVLATANRPTIGYSPCAVLPGESLSELGIQAGAGDTPQTHFGQGFLRFGLARHVEADIIGPDFIVQHSPDARGFADAGVGMKWQFASDAHSAAGVDVLYTAPSGAAAFSAGHSTQIVNLDYARSFGNFGIATTIGSLHSTYAAVLPSLVFSNQFNDRAQWYAEAFAQTHYAPRSGALMGLDGGIQYLLTPAIEVDAEAGRTISDTQRARFVGAGVAIRL